ncbi:DUF1707 SHOCT-like domain-containing protein [Haloglycomyces albus]|uniref:DUF1707 SHOCT-like domain-containing protein n=1 Tax=Haloglycomyces albus TaxID=526067 RepID=UPI00068861EB|nr:DUF1707 domain-containing protein [Haloglycomyces albus]
MSTDPGKYRISDREREQAVELLNSATTEGRLTIGEFDTRSAQVYEAQTRAELDLIFDDLPVELPGAQGVVHANDHRPLEGSYVEKRDGKVTRDGEVVADQDDTKSLSFIEALHPFLWVGSITTSVWLATWVVSGSMSAFWPAFPMAVLLAVGVVRYITGTGNCDE